MKVGIYIASYIKSILLVTYYHLAIANYIIKVLLTCSSLK